MDKSVVHNMHGCMIPMGPMIHTQHQDMHTKPHIQHSCCMCTSIAECSQPATLACMCRLMQTMLAHSMQVKPLNVAQTKHICAHVEGVRPLCRQLVSQQLQVPCKWLQHGRHPHGCMSHKDMKDACNITRLQSMWELVLFDSAHSTQL